MYTLITAANSSEAYALKNSLNTTDVLLGDYLELPEILIKSGKVVQLPDPLEISYTHRMLALCLDKNIDAIYPLRQQEKQLLKNSKQLFTEYGINIF
ncbi:hypothetical protein [Mucilaginibacter ginsenosidivorans]|uniref:PylC N-terminal domain-containing protein n=1 Tax=Mucilaginibacter ginsenosidivorans TaxID=398053 RepID=A0A5B8UXY6_9SPHI|nr:hypothetical protein [Mucilaginibacter ginsenosidivorans]QEC63842.1 hypothetical protein FRZ54_15085 [Mucilaginibacter ginsenosidivorans]